MPQATAKLALQMHKQFSMEVAPEDEEVISVIQALDRDVTEEVFRERYISVRRLDGVPADQASDGWTEKVWPRVLSRSYDGVSLGDTYSRSLVWQVFMFRLVQIAKLSLPLLTIGLTVSIWLASSGIRSGNYLPTLQVVTLAGFLFTALIFANITYGFSVVQWLAPSKTLLNRITDEGLKRRLVETMGPYVGKRLWPVKVTFGERYTRLVGNYFIRLAGAILLFYSAATLCILLICAAFAALGSGGSGREWYYHMAVALVAIPGTIFLASCVAFLILRMAGSMMAVVTAAIILAVTPPMLTFLLTGKSPGKGAVTSSILAGLTGAMATALADRTMDHVQRTRHAARS